MVTKGKSFVSSRYVDPAQFDVYSDEFFDILDSKEKQDKAVPEFEPTSNKLKHVIDHHNTSTLRFRLIFSLIQMISSRLNRL